MVTADRARYRGTVTHVFDPDIIAAVRAHMNDDHIEDGLLIARAHSPLADVIKAELTTFDGEAGQWHVIAADGAEEVVRIPWPGGPISERAHVRREIVALYDSARQRLGLPPRSHD